MKPLKILILSYRSAPFGGGQGIYVKELSESLANLGYHVEVFSGPPYPQLNQNIKLIKSEGLNLFETFNFKDRLLKLFKKQKKTFNCQSKHKSQRRLFPFQRPTKLVKTNTKAGIPQ